MTILSAFNGEFTLRVGSSYMQIDVGPVRLERLEAEDSEIVATMRRWESSSTRWEQKGNHGPMPNDYKLILTNQTIGFVPIGTFVEEIDVTHSSEWKKILPGVKKETFFFSHRDDQQGKARMVAADAVELVANEATRTREIGEILAKKVAKSLEKRTTGFQKKTLVFPVGKMQGFEILGKFGLLEKKLKSTAFFLTNLRDLDGLLGHNWDVLDLGNNFVVVTHLMMRSCSAETATLTIGTRVVEEKFSWDYQERTRQYFH